MELKDKITVVKFGSMLGIVLAAGGRTLLITSSITKSPATPSTIPSIGLGTTYAVGHAVSEMTDKVIETIETAEELDEEQNNQPKKQKVNKGNTIKERRAFRKAQRITKELATE